MKRPEDIPEEDWDLVKPFVDMRRERDLARQLWAEVVHVVEDQANDEGLWFTAKTATEAYLQQELRRLHAAIERSGGEGN